MELDRSTLVAVVDGDGGVAVSGDGTERRFESIADAIGHFRGIATRTEGDLTVLVDQANGSRQHLTVSPDGRLTTAEATKVPVRQPEPDPLTAREPDLPTQPIATPYSGPVHSTGPVDIVPEPAGPRPSEPPSAALPRRRPLWPLMGIIAGVVAVILGAVFFLPGVIGMPNDSEPVSVEQSEAESARPTLSTAEADVPVPGFTEDPDWEAEVPESASTTASGQGVLVVDDEQLSVLDPTTGSERFSTTAPGRVDFAAETTIEGAGALVWRVGDRAWALFNGADRTVEYQLPPAARLSAAGTSVLIKTGNELQTFGNDGIRQVAPPAPGMTPMALDGDRLISAGFSGPIVASDLDGGNVVETQLERPEPDMEIIRWVSAGHGLIIAIWGEKGASVTSGHKVQLVVNSADDGAIASTVTTTTDVVGEADWVRGQGFKLAAMGPYLFSMEDGLLIHDGSESNIEFNMPTGYIAPGEGPDGPILVRGNVSYRSNTSVLAQLDDGPAIVRSAPDTVAGFMPAAENASQ